MSTCWCHATEDDGTDCVTALRIAKPSTTWDVGRDQLARNLEAVWGLAQASGKDYMLLICHEHPLKHHEVSLIEGYRRGTWAAGWPHIEPDQRRQFATRIGTTTWGAI